MQWNHQKLSGWGRIRFAEADIARPERSGIASALASGTGRILPHGNLRSYGDAALPIETTDPSRGISCARLDRILSFDAETGLLEAEAGITLGTLLDIMAPRGWMPPVLPGTGMTTLGGAIANDIHGKNHHQVGSFGLHLAEITLATADGRQVAVTPEDQPELFKATLGGVGQTGLILSAIIRMTRCPSGAMQVRERRMPNLDQFLEAFHASDARFEVGWIDTLARGAALGRGLLEEADFAEHAGPQPKPGAPKHLPPVPSFVLMSPIVRAFNWLYYHRVPTGGRTRLRPLHKFFFPLDRIDNWNRLYGKNGFHQFQCVLPDDTAPVALRKMLEAVSAAALASPLAVLKRMGPGRAGYLSFAMEGFTLALDIPNRPCAGRLLEDLHRLTLEAGGRIYLAKDSCADPVAMRAMYPELDDWRAVAAKHDPGQKFVSSLVQRLDLRGAAS